MGNIKKIFFRDIKALIKNPFAFLIAGGLCIIPALYAWFNIYSNWDPYGNTGNLQIAVATEDKGYVTEKGKKENVSDTVIETLKENESIGWVETPDAQSAIEGVESIVVFGIGPALDPPVVGHGAIGDISFYGEEILATPHVGIVEDADA